MKRSEIKQLAVMNQQRNLIDKLEVQKANLEWEITVEKKTFQELAYEYQNQVGMEVVDEIKEINDSKKCKEGCDNLSSMEYFDPKINMSGSEVSVRHYGMCVHGIAIYDKVHRYEDTNNE